MQSNEPKHLPLAIKDSLPAAVLFYRGVFCVMARASAAARRCADAKRRDVAWQADLLRAVGDTGVFTQLMENFPG